MWAIFNGTIVNAITVIVGSLLGVSAAGKLPERYRQIVLTCLGLVTLTLGMDAGVLKFASTVSLFEPQVEAGGTYGARLAIVMIGSLIIGALIGTVLRIHDRIEAMGAWIHGRFSKQDGRRFAEGFLTASVIFCVGPLTLLGCLRNGAYGDPSYLYIKACLDGFCSLALASAFGWGVLASVLVVIGFQGGLSLLAFSIAEPLGELSIALMTIVGGIVMLATGLMILDIKRIPVADMLPGIFLAPLAIRAAEWILPGWLLPVA
ncbi:MAG: DUF554 domain-containing protein [Planctomycetes bacterium]|nr:DUF554 domain-containing protein [Planctomycetota bacterium]